MSEISIHNSLSELAVTPESMTAAGLLEFTYTAGGGDTLPYRQLAVNMDKPGPPALAVFLHGAGSVGNDNFLQIRIPGPPFLRFLKQSGIKAVVLFPQCRQEHRWVEVDWNQTAHDMPQQPSRHMAMALELLESKIAEFQPDRVLAAGVSMGGFGVWDMVSRRPELFSGILSVCGGADEKQAAPLKHLTVYAIHGDADNAIPVCRSRNIVSALENAGCRKILYREMPGFGHNVWDTVFADDQAFSWLFTGCQ